MTNKYLALSLSLFLTGLGFAQNNKVSIDLKTQKYIGKETELSREKYFSGHFSYTENDLADQSDYLFKELDVKFGRNFGAPRPVTKNKEGFENAIPSIEEAQKTAANNYKYIQKGKLFKDYATHDLIITAHPKEAYQLNCDIDKIAAFDAAYIKNAYPVMPKYYEVMNEPFVHAIDFVKNYNETDAVIVEMSKLHKAVADKVHQEVKDILVGGYSAAWPEYEKNNFAIWDKHMKTFMDIAGESMDFFGTHLYDGLNVTGAFNYRSGSNTDAVLDMIESYSYQKWGKIKPHLISEYGYTTKGMQGKVYSEVSDGKCLMSYNKFLMNFMSKPDRILKAVPFIVGKGSWYYKDPKNKDGNPYPWVITRKSPDGSYEYTHLIKFYELWKGVKGTFIDINSNNPDIQVNGFVDQDKAYIAFNNLDENTQNIDLDFLSNSASNIKNITLRRLYINENEVPHLDYEKDLKKIKDLVLRPGETVVLDCDLKKNDFSNTLNVDSYYSKTYLQEIEANKTISFVIDNAQTSKKGRGFIEMGIARKHALSKAPIVMINGNNATVPTNWAGYDQAPREQFFGVIEIPVDIKLIQSGENTVTITFPDTGGHLSSVILKTEKYNK